MTRTLAAAASTLPAHCYTSAETYARERERIFDRAWLYAGRSATWTEPGAYSLFEIFGESIIIVRGQDGVLRGFYNVCRHRGTRLCERDAGKFAGAIVCPYHAWTFKLDGALDAARNMSGVPDFDKADYPLHRIAVEEVAGCAFVNFEAEPARRFGATAAEFLAPLAAKFERWDISSLVCARSISYDVAANWKLIVQNYSECYHCPVIHPQLDKLSPWDSGSNDLETGAILGGPMRLREAHDTMSVSGRGRAPLGTVDRDDLRHVYYYAIFPATLLSLHPDYVMLHRVVPLGVDRSRVVCEWLFAPEAAGALGFDPSDVVDFWDVTNRQDWHVCELSQTGIASRAYTPGPYSGYESMLAAYDAHYRSITDSTFTAATLKRNEPEPST
jgi:Rieske 2Fe-2S family protein